jgi:hypothetical protein
VDQILVDLDCSGIGNMHVVISAGGVIYAEATYHGAYCRVNLTPHLQLLGAHWYWVFAAMGSTDGSLTGRPAGTGYGLAGQCFAADGSTDGPQGVWANPGGFVNNPANCKVGLGVSLNAEYMHQKNEPGRLIAQAHMQLLSGTTVDAVARATTPQMADLTPGQGFGAYYPCREAVGAIQVLHDAANGFDMDAGPNGCTIVRDSPY